MADEGKASGCKISIVVPVYNTESYLSQCIDSLLSQTYRQIEIILVDDGSTDQSGAICDEYQQTNHRIKVLHQCNKGRVSARKNGLRYASGEFVSFVDSDDWIESDMCERMLCLALTSGADLVTSGFIQEEGDVWEERTDAFQEGLYNSEQQLKEIRANAMIYKGTDRLGLLSSIWTKLYRKELALDAMGLVPETMRRGEDFVFNHLYLLKCRSVYISKGVYYHYRCYEGSTVTSPCPDFIRQIGMSHLILRQAFGRMPDGEKLLKQLNTRILLDFIRLWNGEVGGQVPVPYYCFNYEKLGEGRIVLYGAGKVGTDYHRQLVKTMSGKLVLWVDKNYKKYWPKEYGVEPVERIKHVCFDKVFIAVESEKLAGEIRRELTEKFRIEEYRILWQPPMCYWL
ncbi:MAG TPA: hypothetical protein DF613_01120 [Lachnospiraceae bacterium]|nr:hypothetical protein [Lachnospiraceae bacterium]